MIAAVGRFLVTFFCCSGSGAAVFILHSVLLPSFHPVSLMRLLSSLLLPDELIQGLVELLFGARWASGAVQHHRDVRFCAPKLFCQRRMGNAVDVHLSDDVAGPFIRQENTSNLFCF